MEQSRIYTVKGGISNEWLDLVEIGIKYEDGQYRTTFSKDNLQYDSDDWGVEIFSFSNYAEGGITLEINLSKLGENAVELFKGRFCH